MAAYDLELLKEVEVVLFDCDNTLQLGDKQELHARLGAISTRMCLGYSEEEIQVIGDRSDYREMRQLMVENYNTLHPDADLSQDDFQAVNQEVSGTFDNYFYLADHAKELLEGVKAKGKGLALVTTRGTNSIDRLLEMHGIGNYFDAVVNRDDCPERKPHPAPIQLALKHLRVEDPSSAVYIGDKQEDDVAGGNNAGTLTVLVNEVIDPSGSQPTYHFRSLKPLLTVFAEN